LLLDAKMSFASSEKSIVFLSSISY